MNSYEMMELRDGLDFLLLPRPVVLATCRDDEKNNTNIITIGWSSPVSHRPLIVAMAISPRRYSHDLVDRTKEFVLNLPDITMAEASNWCGRKSGRRYDKFETMHLETEPSATIGTNRIKGCYGYLECKVVQQLVTGDHTTFFGEVVGAFARKDAVKPVVKGGPPGRYFDPKLVKTLQHLGGDMYLTNTEEYVEFEIKGQIDV